MPEAKFKYTDIKRMPDESELLHTVCEEMTEVDIKELHDYMLDMYYRLAEMNMAVGLALPQMGILKRGFVVNGKDMTNKKFGGIFINPVIVSHGDMLHTEKEGCLSEPGVTKEVERYYQIRVKFIDRNGEEKEKTFTGLFARVIQHEIDHLDGKLLSDK